MAATKGNMTLRVEPELKAQAAALFKSLGMDLSTATGIFYRQALRYHGLPFEVKLDEPNEVTYEAMKKLEKVISILCREEPLPPVYRDHDLTNSRNYKDMRECHIEPDWLLIYKIVRGTLILKLIRTGSHSDLF